MAACPDDNTLQEFLEGRLERDVALGLHQHLDGCSACQDLLVVMAGTDQAQAPPTGVAAGALAFAPDEVVAGRYRVLRFLARGGMGQVYLARDQELGVEVALKTLLPHVSAEERTLGRFKREVLLARRVSHPNVCRIFDLGLHQRPGPAGRQTIHFLTMELLVGRTLAQHLRERGPLLPGQALPLVRQMALALDAAHQQGIVHRDFKPDNVFLIPSGSAGDRIVVTDFGLAQACVAPGADDSARSLASMSGGGLAGTPAYMAPEQVEGGEIGPAADIYALGVVLYEMVTGKRPFGAPTPLGVALKRLKEAAPSPRVHRPELDRTWERVILRCLEVEPQLRYYSAGEVARALQGDRDRAGSVGATGLLQRALQKDLQRLRRGPLVALGVAGALAGAGGLALVGSRPAARVVAQQRPAQVETPEGEAAVLLLGAESDLRERRWEEALAKAERVLRLPGASARTQDLAVALRQQALGERDAGLAAQRFGADLSRQDFEAAIADYQRIPAGSFYRAPLAQGYDQAVQRFTAAHLGRAQAARAAGRCRDAQEQLQAVLAIEPQQAAALRLRVQPCGEGIAARGQVPAAPPRQRAAVPPAPEAPQLRVVEDLDNPTPTLVPPPAAAPGTATR